MSLGSIVKQARKSAGVTIEELAQLTKIRSALLSDIELDNFAKCGGHAYARGHLRSIASALGVEPAIFLDHYNLENSILERPIHELLLESSVIAPVQERPKLSLKALSLISAAAVFMVAGGQVVYTSLQPGGGSATKSLIASATPTPTKVASSEPVTPQDLTATEIKMKAVNVQITANRGDSWLSVVAEDGTSIFAGKLKLGQSQTYSHDTSLNIRFGNAGAVDVLVNGKATPVLGAMGEVVNVVYGANPAQ